MPAVRMGFEAREVIASGCARDESFAQIARRLDRPTSTISREVERVGGRHGYRATIARRAATARRVARSSESWSSTSNSRRSSKRGSPSDGRQRRSRRDCHSITPTGRCCACPTRRSTPLSICSLSAGPRRPETRTHLGAALRTAPSSTAPPRRNRQAANVLGDMTPPCRAPIAASPGTGKATSCATRRC